MSNTGSITCGDTGVFCYEPDNLGKRGLNFLRGYQQEPVGTVGPPLVRSAWLEAGSCPDDAYFGTFPNCVVNFNANIDWNLPDADVSGEDADGQAWAEFNGDSYQLTHALGDGSRWTGSIPVSAAFNDPQDISMRWKQTKGFVDDSGATATATSVKAASKAGPTASASADHVLTVKKVVDNTGRGHEGAERLPAPGQAGQQHNQLLGRPQRLPGDGERQSAATPSPRSTPIRTTR